MEKVFGGVSKAAFDEQAVARVFYELEGPASKPASKLGELGICLEQCTSLKQPQDIQRAAIFHETLSTLQAELSRRPVSLNLHSTHTSVHSLILLVPPLRKHPYESSLISHFDRTFIPL